MSAVLENKPTDRVPTTKTKTVIEIEIEIEFEFRDLMFAPFFRKFMFSGSSCFQKLHVFINFVSLVRILSGLKIPHEAGSVSSSFWLILAAERKIIRLGDRYWRGRWREHWREPCSCTSKSGEKAE